MSKRVTVILIGMFFGFQMLAFAGIESRPIDSDDSGTLDFGELGANFGLVYAKSDQSLSNILDVSFGVYENFEFGVELPYVITNLSGNVDSGIGDLAFRPEYSFFKEKKYFPGISFAVPIRTPLGQNAVGNAGWDIGTFLQFSKEFKFINLHLNIGNTIATAGGLDSIRYQLAMEASVSDSFVISSEIINSHEYKGSNGPVNFLVGASYAINDNFTLDAGVGTDFKEFTDGFYSTVGISFGHNFLEKVGS